MKILYVSVLSSPKLIGELAKSSTRNPGYSVQKFHRLVATGLARNDVDVKTLTAPPIVSSTSRKRWWYLRDETFDGIHYHYIPFLNFTGLRQICLFVYSFFYTLFWGMGNRKEKCIVCDVLDISVCLGSVWASKIVGLRSVGIMTDMPGLMVSRSSEKAKEKQAGFISRVNKSYLSSFTHYVFLTEQMNAVVNTKQRPYIVMEGLVDVDMPAPEPSEKEIKRVILYAGGLHERYGLKMLIEGFLKADVDNTELWLYGDGSFAKDLPKYMERDPRIRYYGVRPNREIVEAESRAALLVNPRPTHEEFTQYSFPSKNMEYMVSGTPLLTTVLPGMPKEYYPYVYLFDHGESADGYCTALLKVLTLSDEELRSKGRQAREWVLKYKNNISQSRRIVDLLERMKP